MPRKKNIRKDAGSADAARAANDAREQKRESGNPGGGQGRRDDVGRTGVYPQSAAERPGRDAPVRTERSWGQGKRGAAGYEDAGGSELSMRDGELLGGLTAGPSGEPTIDIHGEQSGKQRKAGRAEGAPSDERERND